MVRSVIITLLLITFFNINLDAQKRQRYTIEPYVFTGLSITNSDKGGFNETSVPYIGGGIMIDRFQFSVTYGKSNLIGTSDSWGEGNVSYYLPLGEVDLFATVGVGSYFNGGVFIEYGTGLYKKVNDVLGFYIKLNSWDDNIYISPGMFLNFYPPSNRRSHFKIYHY